jgi:transcriptional regulator GlxA family with amidase domain
MAAVARLRTSGNAEVLSVQAQLLSTPLVPNPAGAGFAPHHRVPQARFMAAVPSARRALAVIADSMEEPLSMARLAVASGLSKRTLHRVVSREFGLSPMALSRRIRLLEVRAELQAPGPGTTVTDAAFRLGFTHLGRFAGEYARAFGERPSETLRRARCTRARDQRLSA